MSKTMGWVLTDVDRGRWVETARITPGKTGLPGRWSITKRQLHGGLREGVDVVEVDNGALSFTLVPTRGMGLWKGRYEDCELGWRSPVAGPVHPAFVNLADRGGLGWLQGFDECLVRCGLDSNGAPGPDVIVDNNGNPREVVLPLHGRIANSPARRVEASVMEQDGEVTLAVAGVVDEGAPFMPCLRLETLVTTVAGSNAVTVRDRVVNLNTVPRELELLYHCNFGAPFLEEGSRLVAPSREVAPRDDRAAADAATHALYRAPTPGYVEQVYFHRLRADRRGDTVAMLRNRAGTRGVALRFNVRQLPCFTQWKQTVGAEDGYVTGLEPATNYPNPKRVERRRGRVIRLDPGQGHDVILRLDVHTTAAGVAAVEREVAALMGKAAPRAHPAPVPEW